jgi:hypothetical protein
VIRGSDDGYVGTQGVEDVLISKTLNRKAILIFTTALSMAAKTIQIFAREAF